MTIMLVKVHKTRKLEIKT